MSSLFLLNILDVARALGSDPRSATPEEVAAWLIEHYARKRRGGFNYNPAINCLFDLFRGASVESAAVMHCLSSGNPKGRRQNAEAIRAVAPYAEANRSSCYRIDFSAISVGRVKDRTVYIAIKAPMVRVVHNEAYIVLPGSRMSHRPVETQIDFASSIALAAFARDDFAAADFEYLYAGPDVGGQRTFQPIHGSERRVFDTNEIDAFLDVYVRGIGLALEAGLEPTAPNLNGFRVVDPSQPPLV